MKLYAKISQNVNAYTLFNLHRFQLTLSVNSYSNRILFDLNEKENSYKIEFYLNKNFI